MRGIWVGEAFRGRFGEAALWGGMGGYGRVRSLRGVEGV